MRRAKTTTSARWRSGVLLEGGPAVGHARHQVGQPRRQIGAQHRRVERALAQHGLERSDVGRETGVVGLQLFDLPRKGTGPLALADELQDPAIAEERAHEKADDHDDRGQDRGLFPETHFRPPTLVSHADLNLYLMFRV